MARNPRSHKAMVEALGHEPIDYIGPSDPAAAWTFVIIARQNGWVVADPNENGAGRAFVSVFERPEEYA